MKKWKNVSNTILTSASAQAFSNLKKHIESNCLSDIPPGMGTNRNERFHRHLKSVVHRSRIGILLAYALLSILIHAHNNSCIVARKRLVQSVATQSHCTLETRYPPIGVCPKTRVGIHESNANWERDESCEVPASDTLLLYHTAIAKLVLARAFMYMDVVHAFKLIHADVPPCPGAVSSVLQASDIRRNLLANGLKVREVAPDGNCFFSAVATSMLSSAVQWSDCLMRMEYIESEGVLLHV